MNYRIWIIVTAFMGASAVAMGAMGTHLFGASLSVRELAQFETGARYHLFHALALFSTALLMAFSSRREGATVKRILLVAASAFVAGILLFSGGLYILVFAKLRGAAYFVPFGGISFIIGWLALAAAGARPGK